MSSIKKHLWFMCLSALLLVFGCNPNSSSSRTTRTSSTKPTTSYEAFVPRTKPFETIVVPFSSGKKINFKDKTAIEQHFNIKLSSLQKKLDDRGLPLNPAAFLPLPNTPPPQFNENKWKQFLTKVPKDVQDVLKKIHDNKQFISYDMFTQGLDAVMQKFNELVKDQYAVAVLYNKSLHWVSSIASVYFAHSHMPKTAWKPYDPAGWTEHDNINEAISFPKDLDVNHLVIIDDAAYSGSALSRMLAKLDELDSMKGKSVTVFIPFVSPQAHEVMPFFNAWRKRFSISSLSQWTQVWKKYATFAREYERIKVVLVTTDFKLNSVSNILEGQGDKKYYDKEGLKAYKKVKFFRHPSHKILFSKWLGQTLTYTQWKIPDDGAFIGVLNGAQIVYENGNYSYLEPPQNRTQGFHFLPVLVPPYKNFK